MSNNRNNYWFIKPGIFYIHWLASSICCKDRNFENQLELTGGFIKKPAGTNIVLCVLFNMTTENRSRLYLWYRRFDSFLYLFLFLRLLYSERLYCDSTVCLTTHSIAKISWVNNSKVIVSCLEYLKCLPSQTSSLKISSGYMLYRYRYCKKTIHTSMYEPVCTFKQQASIMVRNLNIMIHNQLLWSWSISMNMTTQIQSVERVGDLSSPTR